MTILTTPEGLKWKCSFLLIYRDCDNNVNFRQCPKMLVLQILEVKTTILGEQMSYERLSKCFELWHIRHTCHTIGVHVFSQSMHVRNVHFLLIHISLLWIWRHHNSRHHAAINRNDSNINTRSLKSSLSDTTMIRFQFSAHFKKNNILQEKCSLCGCGGKFKHSSVSTFLPSPSAKVF